MQSHPDSGFDLIPLEDGAECSSPLLPTGVSMFARVLLTIEDRGEGEAGRTTSLLSRCRHPPLQSTRVTGRDPRSWSPEVRRCRYLLEGPDGRVELSRGPCVSAEASLARKFYNFIPEVPLKPNATYTLHAISEDLLYGDSCMDPASTSRLETRAFPFFRSPHPSWRSATAASTPSPTRRFAGKISPLRHRRPRRRRP